MCIIAEAPNHRELQCFRSDAIGLTVHSLWSQTAHGSSARDQLRDCRHEEPL